MIRIQHRESKQTDGLSFYSRVENLMNDVYNGGDFSRPNKQRYQETRTYLLAKFLELLVVEGDIEEAYRWIKSKTSDPIYVMSPVLAASKAIVSCLRAVKYIETTPNLARSLSLSSILANKWSENLFLFYDVFAALSTKKSSSFHRTYPQWNSISSSLLTEIKSSLYSARTKSLHNLTFSSLYVAYELAAGNRSKVGMFYILLPIFLIHL